MQKTMKRNPGFKALRFKNRLSIRSKLILTFTFILLGPALLISTLSYQTAKKEVSDQIFQAADQNVQLLDFVINQYVTAEAANVDYLASLINEGTYTGSEQTLQSKILEPFYRTHPILSSIEFSGKSGYYRNVQGKPWALEGNHLTQPWYLAAMENSGTIVSSPYLSAITGDFVIGISKSVSDGSGVIRLEVKIDELAGVTDAVQIGTTGFAFIMDNEQKTVSHPLLEAGETTGDDWIQKMFANENGQFSYKLDGKDKMMSFTTNTLTGWKIGGTLYKQEFAEQARPILNQTLLVVIASLLVAAVIIFLILTSMFKSLKLMVATAEKISSGDLSARIAITSDDELGKLSQSFNQMAESINASMSSINHTALSLASSSQELSASAEQAAKATEHIADSAQGIHEGASRQETLLTENHERISTISERMNEIGGYVTQLDELTAVAGSKSQAGSEHVQSVVRQMSVIHDFTDQQANIVSGLHEHSHEIDKIIRVIQEIAGQTNLLALNASIEASRAGEHGRGFAVVASEIRKLAEQTASSTSSIKQLIGQIQDAASNAVASMNQTVSEVNVGIQVVEETDRNFKDILTAVHPLSEMSSTLRSITQDIAEQTRLMAASVNSLIGIASDNSSQTENVSASVEEQLASMEQISASAAHLSQTADELSAIVDKFKL